MTTDNAYDDDGRGNPNRIKIWLKMGKWTTQEATLLFLDIDPDSAQGDCFKTFSRVGSVQYEYFDDNDPSADRVPTGCDGDGEYVYLTTEQEALSIKINRSYKDNVRILNQYELATPHEWIRLALEKKISIPWLNWAKKNDLYPSKKTGESLSTKEHPTAYINNDDDIEGKMPNIGVGKLAVKVAWNIEKETKKRAIAKQVMTILQEWADAGVYPETLLESDKAHRGVNWVTSKGNPKLYDIDACSKTLETWNKSRA